ncbi:hypothetical protein [Streptomyces soliscabiei]|uniref:hypothetical protein n=1 Tax=Streptomyces soliscabiei TaxID=588897 RepID=UPI0029AD23EC|nr:hypothetical protein [Streptomyces sp. NY05-11A]MDX2675893.1 hypothetical protein [Streptomyces sp. NY05-11A]
MRRPLAGAALAACIASTVLLSACTAGLAGPYQYYTGTGLHDATAAEAAGTWECVEGTRLTLRPDGSAAFRQLDGQEWDFDDAWRVTGTGTWELTDDAEGQELHLAMTTRTTVATRAVTPAPTASPEVPATYTWRFFVDRNPQKKLVLFFFYGDPDAGNSYVMQRATASVAR